MATEKVRHVLAEVLHHDLNARGDVHRVQTHPPHDALLGLSGVDLRFRQGLALVRQPERQLYDV